MDALKSVVVALEIVDDALESVVDGLERVVDSLKSVVDALDSVEDALESVDVDDGEFESPEFLFFYRHCWLSFWGLRNWRSCVIFLLGKFLCETPPVCGVFHFSTNCAGRLQYCLVGGALFGAVLFLLATKLQECCGGLGWG